MYLELTESKWQQSNPLQLIMSAYKRGLAEVLKNRLIIGRHRESGWIHSR